MNTKHKSNEDSLIATMKTLRFSLYDVSDSNIMFTPTHSKRRYYKPLMQFKNWNSVGKYCAEMSKFDDFIRSKNGAKKPTHR